MRLQRLPSGQSDRYHKLTEIMLTSLNDICEFEDEARDKQDVNILRKVVKLFNVHSLYCRMNQSADWTLKIIFKRPLMSYSDFKIAQFFTVTGFFFFFFLEQVLVALGKSKKWGLYLAEICQKNTHNLIYNTNDDALSSQLSKSWYLKKIVTTFVTFGFMRWTNLYAW